MPAVWGVFIGYALLECFINGLCLLRIKSKVFFLYNTQGHPASPQPHLVPHSPCTQIPAVLSYFHFSKLWPCTVSSLWSNSSFYLKYQKLPHTLYPTPSPHTFLKICPNLFYVSVYKIFFAFLFLSRIAHLLLSSPFYFILKLQYLQYFHVSAYLESNHILSSVYIPNI